MLFCFVLSCGNETPPQLIRTQIETSLLSVMPTEVIATEGNAIVGASPIRGCVNGECVPVVVAVPIGVGVRLELTLPGSRTLPVRFGDVNRGSFDVCGAEGVFELGRARARCDGNPGCEDGIAKLASCHAQQDPVCGPARLDEQLCMERLSVQCAEANKMFEECLASGMVEGCDQNRIQVQMACSACDESHRRVIDTCLLPCAPSEQAMIEVCEKPPVKCPEERLFMMSDLSPPLTFGVCE